jgi:hypothetical protein
MAQFLTGDGRLYEVQHSTGPQARHQTQFESGRFFHTKGNESHAEWEELWATNKHIMRGTDTSPGNGHYYTLRDGGKYGSKWAPRIWEVGELFERNPQVTFYRKDNCSIVANGSQRSWLKFEAFHASFTFPGGIKLYNVVELQWLLEKKAEPTETYFYAEGYGLVGWRSNDRGFSYVSEIHEPGARPDNTMEQISCINPNNFPTPADPSIPFGPLPPPFRAK